MCIHSLTDHTDPSSARWDWLSAAMLMLYLISFLTMRADLLSALETLSLSMRVHMFHVLMRSFFFLCWNQPQVSHPAVVSWFDVLGQAMVRPPFLGPTLIRVSSAILKRLLGHLRCCRNSLLPWGSENDDQNPRSHTCRLVTVTVVLHLSLSPLPHRHRTWLEVGGIELSCTDTCLRVWIKWKSRCMGAIPHSQQKKSWPSGMENHYTWRPP